MKFLKNIKILLIICGGVAAYKSLELIRELKKEGALIKTILTKSAEKFVTSLSVASLSKNKVYTDLFSLENELEMDHIALSRWADLIVVSPATANTISKLSNGICDNLATTVILASDKKIFLVPAMNVRMWEHPSNSKNIKKLKSFGYNIIGPEIGEMACGEYGEGKMTQPVKILNFFEKYFSYLENNKKIKAIVTAGPTLEYIDPVRFISNRSSGKQGYEIAKSLSENGVNTVLISGPTNQKDLPNIKTIKINTADEMYNKTVENLPADIAVFSAAVSDYKAINMENKKIKKKKQLKVDLVKNRDILEYISKHNMLRPKIVAGFAAETNDIDKNAKLKLIEKNCDIIIANDVSRNDIGFDVDDNEVSIYYKNNKMEKIKKTKKSVIANKLVKKLIDQLNLFNDQNSN